MEDVVPSAGGLGDAFAEEEDVIAPGDRIGGATESKGPKLRFCPESNDILYPREDKQRRVLVYGCLSCSYEVSAKRPEMLLGCCGSGGTPAAVKLFPGGCGSTQQRVWWLVCIQKRGAP